MRGPLRALQVDAPAKVRTLPGHELHPRSTITINDEHQQGPSSGSSRSSRRGRRRLLGHPRSGRRIRRLKVRRRRRSEPRPGHKVSGRRGSPLPPPAHVRGRRPARANTGPDPGPTPAPAGRAGATAPGGGAASRGSSSDEQGCRSRLRLLDWPLHEFLPALDEAQDGRRAPSGSGRFGRRWRCCWRACRLASSCGGARCRCAPMVRRHFALDRRAHPPLVGVVHPLVGFGSSCWGWGS